MELFDIGFDEPSYFKDANGGYISIMMDSVPDNPLRFYDPLGTYLTWESRHMSPSENDYLDPTVFMAETVGEERARMCETMQDCLQALDDAGYAACGIYRLEHGLTRYELAEANPFSDRWDSGPVGFAFVEPEKLRDEGMMKEDAIACMESELREYSAWANGEIFAVYSYDEHGEETDVVSCYGFDALEAEFPSIEPIDLDGFRGLKDYAESALQEEEQSKPLEDLMEEAKDRVAERADEQAGTSGPSHSHDMEI